MQVSRTILSIQGILKRPLSDAELAGIVDLERLWVPETDLTQRVSTLFEGDERTPDVSAVLFKARQPQIIQSLSKEMGNANPDELIFLKEEIFKILNILNTSHSIKGIFTLAKHLEDLHDLACKILPSFEKRSRVTKGSINPLNSGQLFINGAVNCLGMMHFCEAIDTFIFLPNDFCLDDNLGEGKVSFWEKAEYKTEEIAIANIDFKHIKPNYQFTLGHVRGAFPNFIYFFPKLAEKLLKLDLQLFRDKYYSQDDLFLFDIQGMINNHDISDDDYLKHKKAFILTEEISHAKDGIDIRDINKIKGDPLIKDESRLYDFFFENSAIDDLLDKRQIDSLDINNSINEISGKLRGTVNLMKEALENGREKEAKFYAYLYLDSIFHRFLPRNLQFIDPQSYLIGTGTCHIFGEKSHASLYNSIKGLPVADLYKRLESISRENLVNVSI